MLVMQYIDPHHCVFITPFLAVGAGILLHRLGDMLGSTRLNLMSVRSACIAKTALLGCLILGSITTFVYPAITSGWNREPYRDQFLRLILEYTDPGDFVVAPIYAVMLTGRRPVPDLIWDTSPDRMRIMPPDLPAICESYSVRLLILDDFAKWEQYSDYLWSHFYQAGVVVTHNPEMPIYWVVLIRN
jgi:hypothetical protein